MGINENLELMKKIEATLFLSARFLTVNDLVRLTGVDSIMIKRLLDDLEKKYKNEDSALRIIKRNFEEEQLFKMDVKQDFHGIINRIVSGKAEFNKGEQETLAIIAYKQPIKQSIVVKIRGNKAYDHIKHAIVAGLVRAKRSGRTYELNLTEQFYEYFNLDKK
ncbi:MAG: SMC-Scp complex subunit ScpB [archaeon]|nr:MAG: SMC-Scp complex subunit ScpB [archaeon]